MRRIDAVGIIVTLCLIIVVVLGQVKLPSGAPDIGRRPMPATPPAAFAPAAPQPAPEPEPQRVRRPLPEPSPGDPLFNVNVEAIPAGKIGLGTSFPVANGLWLTARHVANGNCRQVFVVIGGAALPAQIRYLHPQADLALLQTQPVAAPILPIATQGASAGEAGYSFGFPHGSLGGFAGALLGRSRMQLNGRLQGTDDVLVWAEERRFPDTLEALSGISGGPMLDEKGDVIGITVAASMRRGRVYSVAPEILHDVREEFSLHDPSNFAPPVSEVTAPPVALEDAGSALQNNARIVKAVCQPGAL